MIQPDEIVRATETHHGKDQETSRGEPLDQDGGMVAVQLGTGQAGRTAHL